MGKRFKLFAFLSNLFSDNRPYVNETIAQDKKETNTICAKHDVETVKEEAVEEITEGIKESPMTSTDELLMDEKEFNHVFFSTMSDSGTIITCSYVTHTLDLDNTKGIKERKLKKSNTKKYDAALTFARNNKTINFHIGSFDSIEEAHRARLNYILDLI